MTDGILLAEIQRDRMLTPVRHDHHRRGPRAEPQHRLPPRLPQAAAAPPPRPEGHHHLGHHRPRALRPALRRRRPIVEVSGRTYPVEVRYRPLDESEDDGRRRATASPRTRSRAICDAVEELAGEGAGDVLVFLSRRARDPRHRRRAPGARRAGGCAAPRSCRCTRGCPPPSSTGSSSRTPAAGSCSPPTSPRPR